MERHTDHTAVAATILILHIVDSNGTILKFESVDHTLHVGMGDRLVTLDLIDLIDIGRRVGQFAGHSAVVGEKKQACGIAVKTSHRIDAFLAAVLDEQHDGMTVVRIVEGGNVALRFVEKEIAFGFAVEHFATLGDHIALLDFVAEGGDHLTADGDSARLDQLVGIATRADARVGDVLVETGGAVKFLFRRSLTMLATVDLVLNDIFRAFHLIDFKWCFSFFRMLLTRIVERPGAIAASVVGTSPIGVHVIVVVAVSDDGFGVVVLNARTSVFKVFLSRSFFFFHNYKEL
jgi:hypothetical protein